MSTAAGKAAAGKAAAKKTLGPRSYMAKWRDSGTKWFGVQVPRSHGRVVRGTVMKRNKGFKMFFKHGAVVTFSSYEPDGYKGLKFTKVKIPDIKPSDAEERSTATPSPTQHNEVLDRFRAFCKSRAEAAPKSALKAELKTASKAVSKAAPKCVTFAAPKPATSAVPEPATLAALKPATLAASKPATSAALKPATSDLQDGDMEEVNCCVQPKCFYNNGGFGVKNMSSVIRWQGGRGDWATPEAHYVCLACN